MTKIAVFVGSLQQNSLNKKLAKNLETLAPEGVTFDYVDLGSIPLYNQDLENDFPSEVTAAKALVEAADGVLFVTPEYNRSIPGVLKNAIDWVSRPWGHNSFDSKPVGIVGATNGHVGTGVAQSDLRHIAGYLNTRLMGQPELYFGSAHERLDENGVVKEVARESVQKYVDAFIVWVEKQKD